MSMKLKNDISHYICSICGKRVKLGEDVYQAYHGIKRGYFTVHADCLVDLSNDYLAINLEDVDALI